MESVAEHYYYYYYYYNDRIYYNCPAVVHTHAHAQANNTLSFPPPPSALLESKCLDDALASGAVVQEGVAQRLVDAREQFDGLLCHHATDHRAHGRQFCARIHRHAAAIDCAVSVGITAQSNQSRDSPQIAVAHQGWICAARGQHAIFSLDQGLHLRLTARQWMRIQVV